MKSTKLPSWSRRLFGLEAVRVPPYAFSVSETALGYLALDEQGELYCRDAHFEPVTEDAFQSGPLGGRVQDRESFSRSLDALLGRITRRPQAASLVVPDNWLRIVFVELADWPRRPQEQLELVRFKLGKVVPYRVDELRLGFVRVAPLESGPYRFLVGFGIDAAFGQLEAMFDERGVRVGNIVCESLALFESLRPTLASAPLAALVYVGRDRYTVMATLGGSPVVYRSKSHPAGAPLDPVERELRLTRRFLQEKLPPGVLSEVALAAPELAEGQWQQALEDVFERPVSLLSHQWPTIPGLVDFPTHDAAPLLGAALSEVA